MPSSTTIAGRLAELGITLPETTTPLANYVPAVRTGNLLFISGHVSARKDGSGTGKLGAERSVDEGVASARIVGIALLATIQAQLGSLERVARIVKVLGLVNATGDFTQHPAVINGASDLFVDVFGDRGRHARSAFGVASLPSNASVEIEIIVELLT